MANNEIFEYTTEHNGGIWLDIKARAYKYEKKI